MKLAGTLLFITCILLHCYGGPGGSKAKFQPLEEEAFERGVEQKEDEEAMSESALAFAKAYPLHHAAATNNAAQVRQALYEGYDITENVPFLVPIDVTSGTFLQDEAGRMLPPEMPEGEASHGNFSPLAFAAMYDSVEAAEAILDIERPPIEILFNVFEIAIQSDSERFVRVIAERVPEVLGLDKR
jgi:hypothetical protein